MVVMELLVVAAFIFFFIFMIIMSLFGNNKPNPEEYNMWNFGDREKYESKKLSYDITKYFTRPISILILIVFLSTLNYDKLQYNWSVITTELKK